ncbi:Neurogenic locus notch homolog protein 1 (Notch 1) [Cleaved into: Notch 1 extracellular truncation (NEXT) [Durusdinium trenchii]|uniref:Neurogenic locus notch homolog protein 1 (Notch 1) [Cleaved into: Notch 1 extracellular truncation (NEXT) n=1 Tax=Durusdinium trenchii TaxID=1381693 RepID=A0ABP0HI79_9DINO
MAELQVAPYMWILVLFFLSLLQPTEAVRNALDGPTLEGQPVQPTVQPTQPPNQTEEWRPSTVTEVGKCSIKLGDHFDAASSILLPLDLAWLSGSALIALALILWTPDGLSTRAVGAHSGEAPMDEEGADEGEGGEDSRSPDSKDAPESTSGAETVQRPKLEAIGWHRVAFDSITSHAAGIVGFIGFQKIVVSRIVALSDACDLWSIENILLYTTLALSVVAVFASFVFLGVDYARRLAIYAAQRKGYQLTMEPKDLKDTGLGIAILLLGLLMLLLYGCVIVKEAENSDAKQQEIVIDKLWVAVDIAAGGIALALFYFNLRGLHRSPKMQFDAACHGEHKLTLEEFLEEESGRGMETNVFGDGGSLANFLQWLAGEDLVLLAFKGTRHAIFPQQRRGPLVHVVCGVLAIGAFPLLVQLGAERFFGYPDLVELKSTTGTIAEIELDGEMKGDSWSLRTLQTLVNPKPRPKKFVFLDDEMTAKLQVRTTFRKTSMIQLCCGGIPCSRGKLKHRLIKFFDQPVDLDVPPDVPIRCTLTLQGFSTRAVTEIPVELKPKREHHLCDCMREGCQCCDGYSGSLSFQFVRSRNMQISSKHYRSLSKLCSVVPCAVPNSNRKNGTECACEPGYTGNITWNGSVPEGACDPAPCGVKNATLQADKCICDDGFDGKVEWGGGKWIGVCQAVTECNIFNSNGRPGKECKCRDGFRGSVDWHGPHASGNCTEAACNIPNAKGTGPQCECENGFAGKIVWKGDSADGMCTPAPCQVPNSNMKPGSQCKCLEWYTGKIHWQGAVADGRCSPRKCVGKHLNGKDGPDCACADGYSGTVRPAKIRNRAFYTEAVEAMCEAAPCHIQHSNGEPGPACRCAEGFNGSIVWNGSTPSGRCEALPCNIENSNMIPGPKCHCLYGFEGTITWKGSKAIGPCKPWPCEGDGVNGEPGPNCSCRAGFNGTTRATTKEELREVADDTSWYGGGTTWKKVARDVFQGECHPIPCDIQNSNKEAGPNCSCRHGFSGSIVWNGSAPTGSCEIAACNISNSNMKPGPECKCKDGFTGTIHWHGAEAYGSCTAIPCLGSNVNHQDGPDCGCADGFNGTVLIEEVLREDGEVLNSFGFYKKAWRMDYEYHGVCRPALCNIEHSNQVAGLGCHCQDGYNGKITWKGNTSQGLCKPAPCNVGNSNRKAGPVCDCLEGYSGTISWTGSQHSGACREMPCVGEHVNGVSGPGCRCKDGYAGTVNAEVNRNDTSLISVLHGNCTRAPCNVSNSNHLPGTLCQCLPGYIGSITWNGSVAGGRCMPAPCRIPHSNQKKGLACRCLDGYSGAISWQAWTPSGTCVAAPCRIQHSDYAAGPDCRCLPGFSGQITWTEDSPQGECLPLPVCSRDVVHTAWLRTQLQDSQGHTCEAGQQLVFHGHECADGDGKIQWMVVESQPVGRCKWDLSEEEGSTCGRFFFHSSKENVMQLFSKVVPPPPMECSRQAARPRCDSQIFYTTTTRKALDYSCSEDVGHILPASPQLVEFQGELCGYDLIQWKSMKTLLNPESSTIPRYAGSCAIKPRHRGSSCGEIPHGEHLPHGCLHLWEPAVFELSPTWRPLHKGSSYSLKSFDRYSLKFFDNGMAYACGNAKHSWSINCHWMTGPLTDEWHLHFQMPAAYEHGMEFAFQRADDDERSGEMGARFQGLGRTTNLKLISHDPLPSWWDAAHNGARSHDGNVEALLWQCKLFHYQNGICYQATVGVGVWVLETSESTCRDLLDDVSQVVGGKSYYTYSRSARGSQIYVNTEECLPLATRYELQVEVVSLYSDVGPVVMEVASADTRCRKTLRFVARAEDLSRCKHAQEEDENFRRIKSMFDVTADDDEEEDVKQSEAWG